jgi:hypothetical protein
MGAYPRRRLFQLAAACALALACVAGADAQAKKSQPKKGARAQSPEAAAANDLPPARIAGEFQAEPVSDPGKQSDWPAIAHTSGGALWAIYVEWDDRDADRVLVRRRDADGSWDAPVLINSGARDHYSPAIAACGEGALAIWSGQTDDNFELYAAPISASGEPGSVERLTRAPHSDFNARAVSDAAGNVTLVWQSFRAGNADVYARRFEAGRWGAETRISESEANDWEPAVALDHRGVAWISYDTYHSGNYDIMLRSFDGRASGTLTAVTAASSAQFHSSVAVDGEDRVWIAWDDGGSNWGKDFSRSSSAPGSRGLHYSRTLGLRVYANGRLLEASAALQDVLTGRMRRYAELPHLAFDGNGALWLVFRHWTETKPNEIYHFYATRLSGASWSQPYRLANSSGHNSQYASLASDADGGLTAAYSSDGRSATNVPSDQTHAMHYLVHAAQLPKGAGPPAAALTPVRLPERTARHTRRQRHTMTLGGRTYHLMLGDAHRHTDIRGHSGVDGSVLDTYRYAMDAAQLNWLGTADHNEALGGRWPDGLRDYQWWYTQKIVDLMTHAPSFIGVYSYEHSMARPAGHRNILFLKRGAPLRPIDRQRVPEDNLPPNLWKWMEANVFTQPGQKAVVVPHTFAAGPLADWNWPNARFDCLLEIYQGCRGSYEAYRLPEQEKRGPTQVDDPGHYAQDALAKGNVYGFVSFSDHGSTHNSWAGVWTLSEDRQGILDAMYDRRTYAASDEIILRVSASGHMPGEEFTAARDAAPEINASIQAPDEILRVDVVKDGKYIYTARPGGRSASIRFKDQDAGPGKSYYYLRVFQRDTENPNGDPEIAWVSPFYVTYR